jgi:glycosyltransferase involved in cell wall biosynthesis
MNKIIHHTIFDFPLDKHFLGESIVIGNLLRGLSQNENYVISCGQNKVNCSDKKIDDKIVSEQFGASLEKFIYHKDLKKYFKFIKNQLKTANSPLILNYHFPRKDLDVSRLVKSEFGEDVKTLLHLHCMPELFEADRYNHSSDKRSLKEMLSTGQMDKYVAVSNAVKSAFTYSNLIPKEKIVTVKNGVDSELYVRGSLEEKLKLRKQIGIEGDFVIGYVGRMNENKGVNTFLELMRLVERLDIEDISFVYGSSNGSEREEFMRSVQQRCPKLLYDNRIKLSLDISKLVRGGRYKSDVEEHFQSQLVSENITKSNIYGGVIATPIQNSMDLYVHPAKSEALGLSILESLALGIPVIGSDTGGICDIVNDDNGEFISIDGGLNNRHIKLSAYNDDFYATKNAESVLSSVINMRDRIKTLDIMSPNEIRTQILNGGYSFGNMAKSTQKIYDQLSNKIIKTKY